MTCSPAVIVLIAAHVLEAAAISAPIIHVSADTWILSNDHIEFQEVVLGENSDLLWHE